VYARIRSEGSGLGISREERLNELTEFRDLGKKDEREGDDSAESATTTTEQLELDVNDEVSCDEERVAGREMSRDWRSPAPPDDIGTSLCEREWERERAGDEPPRVTGCSKLAARPLGFWAGIAICV